MPRLTETRWQTGAAAPDAAEFVGAILPRVSRTFALTIPLLRQPLRDHIGLSYVLCRIVDTVEDHPGLDREARDRKFDFLLDRINETSPSHGAWDRFLASWPPHPNPDYETLMQNAALVMEQRFRLAAPVRDAVDECIRHMILGMRPFPSAGKAAHPVEACADLDRLEEYCHAAAGTVGILLSHLFQVHLDGNWLTRERVEQGRRFGLGLQLTNVIKDHTADGERGVSYLPSMWLENGLAGAPLTREGLRVAAERTLEHLDEAEAYILAIPPDSQDLRLFCLWAQHLAMGTLRAVAEGRGKLDRNEVVQITVTAQGAVTDNSKLERLHREYREAVCSALRD